MSRTIYGRIPTSMALLTLAATACMMSGCFEGTRELVQRPLEPIGDDDQQIVVIPIHNEISSHGNEASSFSSCADGSEICLRLRAAGRDKHVKAVVLDLDTGGGDVTATDMIYRQVMLLHDVGKPVVAVMDGVCASGGYYIATAADSILTAPSTITGSIGVIFESPDFHQLMSTHLGVSVNVIKSGAFKDIASPTRAMTDDERALLQKMVDQSYEQFLGVVAERRSGHGGIPADKPSALEHIRPIADGRVLTGEQAVSAGLADRFGYLFDGIEVARRLAHIEKTPQVIRYERDHGLFGFSEQEKNTHINAGVEINGGAMALPFHARLEYRWASW